MIDQLTLYPFEPFTFKTGFNNITVAQPRLFYDLVRGFQPITFSSQPKGDHDTDATESSNSVLSRKGETIEVKKACLFLGDVIQVPELDRLFLKPALTDLITQLDDEDYQQLYSAYTVIHNVADKLCLSSSYPLEETADFNPSTLLGLCKFHFIQSDIHDAYDEIQTILDIAGALHLEKTLVTTHLIQECSLNQIKYVINETKRLNLQLVDLELRDSPFHLTDGENHFVDKDLVCLF